MIPTRRLNIRYAIFKSNLPTDGLKFYWNPTNLLLANVLIRNWLVVWTYPMEFTVQQIETTKKINNNNELDKSNYNSRLFVISVYILPLEYYE